MIKSTMFVAILLQAILVVQGNRQADWVDPTQLKFSWIPDSFYAGYLSTNNDRNFFYSYYPSQTNPRKDPVVVWFGSGPGCSGLYSMLYSKGPFVLTRNSTQFRVNNFAWNKRANVVFLQSPATVGFSTGNVENITDDTVASDHLFALISFFHKFKDLKDQDLYLAGQGYAGIYIPYLAQKIRDYNSADYVLPEQHILLKGLFLGNPCTNARQCHEVGSYNQYSYEFLYHHYFYTHSQYEKYRACRGVQSEQCKKIQDDLDLKFHETGVDRKNIFSQCLEQNTEQYPNIPCLDQIGILKFLNQDYIQKALHTNLAEGTKWNICNQNITKNYQRSDTGSLHLYPNLLRNYRITVYSGALDASNPISGTIQWIQELRDHYGYATTKQWQPWQMDGINGGEVWKMRNLTFVSLRSAGHMVFTDQPQLGFHVYDSFLNNTM